ncbi:MAG: hypothetical protein A3F70_07495 [Acidobacteria bacterium RIFCSPLOWO2_12_FULL_67_14]|nr:MAG: hypothetical protein A3H29_04230 [Acidobacteria bacterium RIFCSPLOWO2_02_FULL_67_21]OFW36667.1 MAG: hypothetical protein A3F70_07495 [Acidobacteria bacterium RIFCSPLOWO2_12_FULL_67_14]
MVPAFRTTTSSASRALAALFLTLGSGFCPDHAVAAQATAQRRYEAILRTFRDTKNPPVPLLAAEVAWSVKIGIQPSAPAVQDADRVYIPLRENMLVALQRESGVVAWIREVETAASLAVGADALFVAGAGTLRALDAATGAERWSVPLEATQTTPLVFDSGWLIAVVEPGEVRAFRAGDGRQMWRRPLGAAAPHPPVPGGERALYLSLADSRVLALALDTGEPLWEQQLAGTLSPPAAARDRVFVGSTNNFFYALDPADGSIRWQWRNGGDVIGAAVDGEVVYFASLDNIIRAVNRGNGNQRWRKPTGTRPVQPPAAFRGIVVLPGLSPAVTVFVGETGAVMGTYTAKGDLLGPPLLDPAPKPFQVAFITLTREGVVEALRPAALMLREDKPVTPTALPGRALGRERVE